jgi:hypothetical protein
MEKDIKFISSNSWLGSHYTMIVDGIKYSLSKGHWRYGDKFGDEIDHAIFLLKSEYGIVRTREQINFEWDGSM